MLRRVDVGIHRAVPQDYPPTGAFSLSDAQAALPYLRAIVVNLTRNRHRHLRVVRLRTPAAAAPESCEQAAIAYEDHQEVIAALAGLRAHAEDFSAHPDAWARIRARSLAAGRRRGVLRWGPVSDPAFPPDPPCFPPNPP